MEDNSVDAIVTDPPYGLSFMNKEWDSFGTDTRQPGDEHYWVPDNPYGRSKARYGWNQDKSKLASSNRAFQEGMTPIFAEALRVAKPGAHLLCFGGTRTFHRMACAIEDAGWEIRDCIMWVYGSGFPHSMDVAKAIDKASGYVGEVIGERTVDVGMQGGHMHAGRKQQQQQQVRALSDQAKQWDGWGTCLKPAWEPIIVARKPLDGTVANNVLKWGVGAMNIDACRVPTFSDGPGTTPKSSVGGRRGSMSGAMDRTAYDGSKGRFPANLVHDGSQMVLELFPESKGQQANVTGNEPSHPADGVCYGEYSERQAFAKRGDTGSAARFFNTLRDGEESADRTYADRGGTNFAAKPGMRREPTSADRFFYCAKASKKDRGEGNNHPTVKPIALMEWLVTLVTPQGGVVLDPFAGSGTTLVACERLGFDSIGIEREAEYVEIIRKRLGE
jgi:site-specific DNA-methyltransferase (adenine-specific)